MEAPSPYFVSEDHEAVVRLAPDGATHTLGGVAHGVKGEEVVLTDLELVPQVLQPRLGRGGEEWRRQDGQPPLPKCLSPPPATPQTRRVPSWLTFRMRLWV